MPPKNVLYYRIFFYFFHNFSWLRCVVYGNFRNTSLLWALDKRSNPIEYRLGQDTSYRTKVNSRNLKKIPAKRLAHSRPVTLGGGYTQKFPAHATKFPAHATKFPAHVTKTGTCPKFFGTLFKRKRGHIAP